jgi:hypothetical protein
VSVFFARSNGIALHANSRAAQIELEKLPRGVPLRVEATQPRNGKQHRLFWAFCALVAECVNDGPVGGEWDAERVATLLKLATGHVETVKLSRKDAARLGVEYAAIPKSISFASMDGDAFGKFMDAAFIYVRDELCPFIKDSPAWGEIEIILRNSFLMGEAA